MLDSCGSCDVRDHTWNVQSKAYRSRGKPQWPLDLLGAHPQCSGLPFWGSKSCSTPEPLLLLSCSLTSAHVGYAQKPLPTAQGMQTTINTLLSRCTCFYPGTCGSSWDPSCFNTSVLLCSTIDHHWLASLWLNHSDCFRGHVAH